MYAIPDCGDRVQVASEADHICRCQRDKDHDGPHREYVGDDDAGASQYHFWAPMSEARTYTDEPEAAERVPQRQGLVH